MVLLQRDGWVKFEMFCPSAGQVRVVGTFASGCQSMVPMSSDGDGWWTVRLQLEPGAYEFLYLVDDDIWLPDYAAHGVSRSRSGQWISRLEVEGLRQDSQSLAMKQLSCA